MNSVVTDGLSTLYLAINLMKIIPLVTIAIGAIMIIMAVILFFVCIVYKVICIFLSSQRFKPYKQISVSAYLN